MEWIGTEEKPIKKLQSEKILDAIAEGNSIRVEYAEIVGNLNLKDYLDKNADDKLIIK